MLAKCYGGDITPQAEAAREAEEGQEADEAGRRRSRCRRRRSSPCSTSDERSKSDAWSTGTRSRHDPRHPRVTTCRVPFQKGALRPPSRGAGPARRHLYVHLPFCAHRCGYCDFVTVVGRDGEHGGYVDALLARARARARRCSRRSVETVFLGGGTPTFTEPAALARLLAGAAAGGGGDGRGEPGDGHARARPALLREHGVDRVSLGAQTLPAAPARRCSSALPSPDDVRRRRRTLSVMPASTTSRSTSSTGSRARAPPTSTRDLAEALALEPEHLSCYELEAKPGTRFTHAHGDELDAPGRRDGGLLRARRRDADGAGYRWYETANFCRRRARRPRPPRAPQPRLLARSRLPRDRRSARSRPSAACAGGTRPASPRYLAALAARRAAAARARAARARDAPRASA